MIQAIINGLLIGGVYSLIAVGLTMIHGVMKIVNFAQGEFLAIGMYISYVLYQLLPEGTLPYWLLLPVAVVMFFIGSIFFKASISRVIGKESTSYILLTVGLSYLLSNGLQLIFGPNYYSLQISDELKYGTIESLSKFNLYIMDSRLIAFAFALVFVFIVNWFLNKTDIGCAMRATAENQTVAASLGINTKLCFICAFSLGTMFAGISGLLITPMFMAYPKIGTTFSTIAMSSMVLGGLGNIRGAMIGGLIIGVVESLTSIYVSSELAPVAINAVLMLVLIFRPYGIFGKGERKA